MTRVHDKSETQDRKLQAKLLRALAHPTRLAILASLEDGTRCVNEVCELLRMAQPHLSKHLAVLRSVGVVNCVEDGRKRCYSLSHPDQVRAMMTLLEDHETRRLELTADVRPALESAGE